MKRRRQPEREIEAVPHPRYGSKPIVSGLSIPEQEVRDGYWGYRYETIFPESVLMANPDAQNYSVFPRRYYVDILRKCHSCGLPFIFFAREQRYWYETLRFYVDADCVHCPVCRRDARAQQRRVRRYSDLVGKANPTPGELMSLVDDGTYLLQRGVLRDLNRLGHLKNTAIRHIPEYRGTAALVAALTKARAERNGDSGLAPDGDQSVSGRDS